jgi:hypothetical protein
VALGAALVLHRAGARPFAGPRAALWLAGPAAFGLAAWASSLLPL